MAVDPKNPLFSNGKPSDSSGGTAVADDRLDPFRYNDTEEGFRDDKNRSGSGQDGNFSNKNSAQPRDEDEEARRKKENQGTNRFLMALAAQAAMAEMARDLENALKDYEANHENYKIAEKTAASDFAAAAAAAKKSADIVISNHMKSNPRGRAVMADSEEADLLRGARDKQISSELYKDLHKGLERYEHMDATYASMKADVEPLLAKLKNNETLTDDELTKVQAFTLVAEYGKVIADDVCGKSHHLSTDDLRGKLALVEARQKLLEGYANGTLTPEALSAAKEVLETHENHARDKQQAAALAEAEAPAPAPKPDPALQAITDNKANIADIIRSDHYNGTISDTELARLADGAGIPASHLEKLKDALQAENPEIRLEGRTPPCAPGAPDPVADSLGMDPELRAQILASIPKMSFTV